MTWPSATRGATARVEHVLGPADDPRVQTEAVIRAHGLPLEFPAPVVAAARRLPAGLRPVDLHDRADLRDLPLVTIDGENARDFDDAILVEPRGSGFRLHGRRRRRRALRPRGRRHRPRGARPRHQRLLPGPRRADAARSPVERPVQPAPRARIGWCRWSGWTSTPTAGSRAAEFLDGVIRSAARLTYTEVAAALVDARPGDRAPRSAACCEPLEHAERLAAALLARRRARGAIDFDLPEAEILLDLRGRPEQIVRAERNVAHRLIEECMLAANEAVARELMRRRIPAIHRVHEPPDAARIQDLARFLEGFGLRLRLERGRATPAAFQAVIDKAEGRPEARLVHTVLLRTHAAGTLRGRAARAFRPGARRVHALHLADPALPRPRWCIGFCVWAGAPGRRPGRAVARSPRSRRGASGWRWTPSARSCS